MKKIVISLILALSVVSSAYAEVKSPQMKQAIRLYKNRNFTGAVQTLEQLTAKDSGNALAHYYLGMTYVQIGLTDKAKKEYENVLILSPGSQLATNAKTGINNLDPQLPAVVTTIQKQPTKDFLSEEVKYKIQEKDIKAIIENTNNNRENTPDLFNRIENLDPEKKKSSNDVPTKEQIADALQTLTKAGLNPSSTVNTQVPQINPEMMQMNMLMSAFGNNGNNNNMNGSSMNNMMPYLMMMQNGQGNNNIDKETMQTMMSNMMMPNMMNLYENNNNNNN